MPADKSRLAARFAKFLNDTATVYRDPDTTPSAPHANRDVWGTPVKSNPPSGTQSGRRQVAEYRCSLVPPGSPSTMFGSQVVAARQSVPHAPWIVVFLTTDYTDGKADDELHINGITLKVIIPGGVGTHSLFRLVNCQEVKE